MSFNSFNFTVLNPRDSNSDIESSRFGQSISVHISKMYDNKLLKDII